MQDGDSDAGLVKPFLDHLEDLRGTILKCLITVVVGTVAAFSLSPQVLALLKVPLEKAGRDPASFLMVLEVMGGLSIAARIAIWGGIMIAVPVCGYFIADFVFPGLKTHERNVVTWSMLLAAGCFAVGVVLAYGMILPQALRVLFRIDDWMGVTRSFVSVTDYVSFLLKLLLAFGLVFELPVVVLALGQVGLVSAQQLRAARRYVIVGLFVTAMLMTPPDPFTQLAMAVPMVLLYELCIWLIWMKERSRPSGNSRD